MIIVIFAIILLIGITYLSYFSYCCKYRSKINDKIRNANDSDEERKWRSYRDNESFRCKLGYKDCDDAEVGVPLFFTIVAGLAVLFMLIACIVNNATAVGDKAALKAEREVLQHEVYMYSQLGDIESKKQTMNDVKEFNSKLAKNKIYEKNFWVGCFYADIYSDIEFIKFE